MPTMVNTFELSQSLNTETILQPVTQVFEDITSVPSDRKLNNVSPATTRSIQEIFPEQEYDDKNIQKAKVILGDLANSFSKEDLRDIVAQVEYLAESWLDDFERDVFNGKTLNELLHDRGGI